MTNLNFGRLLHDTFGVDRQLKVKLTNCLMEENVFNEDYSVLLSNCLEQSYKRRSDCGKSRKSLESLRSSSEIAGCSVNA